MSITLQPWKLQLLSVPKSYPQSISGCTHAIVKNIFFPQRLVLFVTTLTALKTEKAWITHAYLVVFQLINNRLISRDTLFSFTQNALELNIVANVEVIANDFMSLHLEGMKVSEDVFCAFMVDDPDGIGKFIPLIDFFSRSFYFYAVGRKEGRFLVIMHKPYDLCGCMNNRIFTHTSMLLS